MIASSSAPRRVVYTAIYGGFDQPKPHAALPGVDFLCFTDNPNLRHPDWEVCYDPPRHAHPRMAAKFHKLVGHERLAAAYDQSVWIDGSVELHDGKFVELATSYLRHSPLAMFAHPWRGDIFQELDASLELEKYRGLPLREQVDHYRQQGFTSDNGLYHCGVLIRDLRDPALAKLGHAWMQENLDWTYQDQISFPYVIWRQDFRPAVLPFPVIGNRWIEWHEHEREEKRKKTLFSRTRDELMRVKRRLDKAKNKKKRSAAR
jgi:hypothetical protein